MSAAEILDLARAAGVRIATAESCTAGMIAAALTDPPGASDVFDRGFVTYSNAAKIEMLGVSSETLAELGAVSQEVAEQMAVGALTRSDAALSVAVTGIAGPGGSEHKPEGRVCFAVAATDAAIVSETVEFGAIGRDAVRHGTMKHALELLAHRLTSRLK